MQIDGYHFPMRPVDAGQPGVPNRERQSVLRQRLQRRPRSRRKGIGYRDASGCLCKEVNDFGAAPAVRVSDSGIMWRCPAQ